MATSYDTAAEWEARRLLGDVARKDLQHAVQVDFLSQVEAALYSLTQASSKTMRAFVQAIVHEVPALQSEIEKAHAQVAAQAQAAILTAYDNSLLGTPPYRAHALLSKNRRYAGGILRSVLASDNFVSYDAKGIYIGDTRQLDARARQWRRLNYGAGGAAGGGAEIFTVRWSNQNFYLEEPGAARPAFRIPQGAWFGQEFYPVSELQARHRLVSHMTGRAPIATINGQEGVLQKSRMTRGIRGQHWLAAGIAVVAENLPAAYTNALKKLWLEGDKAIHQAVGEAGATRPGAPRVTVTVSSKAPNATRANLG